MFIAAMTINIVSDAEIHEILNNIGLAA